jgi:hypothetical protein
MHPLEPSGGGGATAYSGLSRTRVYYAPIDMAIHYCKMFFTESAARGLIDVIDVIDHAWRPIDTPPAACA